MCLWTYTCVHSDSKKLQSILDDWKRNDVIPIFKKVSKAFDKVDYSLLFDKVLLNQL